MRYWVVDSETTGVKHEDKAVEVAGFFFEDGKMVDYYQSLVNPGIPIPPEASAIHHIVDGDVKGSPSIEEAMVPFFEKEFDYVIAHNAAFDKRFMDFGTCPWLCTWKLSMRVYPDAPSYGNQVLSYYLGLPRPEHAAASMAHRALYDSEVTSHLFLDILSKATTEDPWEAMAKLTNNPTLLKKVAFGAHKGKLWSEVPRSYLDYILHKSSGWDENIMHTARHYYGN